MAALLPIGHELWTSWHMDWASNDSVERRYLYRGVAHRQVDRFTGDTVGETLAEVTCLKVESREADMNAYYTLVCDTV
jgi:hypothetical protein